MLAKKRKNRLNENVLPQYLLDQMECRDSFHKSLELERKLEGLIKRKKLEISDAVKKTKKKNATLRIFLTSIFSPALNVNEFGDVSISSWVLKVEGQLVDIASQEVLSGVRLSSFLRALVIELDRDQYGPENHLFDWNRTPNCEETEGFQISRHGNSDVSCKVYVCLNNEPPKFKPEKRLADLLGISSPSTRTSIISSLWHYIKTNKLQDHVERYSINCDTKMRKVFGVKKMPFDELSSRVQKLLTPADPYILNFVIKADLGNPVNRSYFDIQVEINSDETEKRKTFLINGEFQRELETLDNKIHNLVEDISLSRINFEFFERFSESPVKFLFKWLDSQSKDYETFSGSERNAENERHSEFYYQDWIPEAVGRYFFNKVQKQIFDFDKNVGSV